MSKIYTKRHNRSARKYFRLLGLIMCILGTIMVAYFAFPLLAFQIYLRPVFASNDIATPIPKTSILSGASFRDLLQATTDSITGVDYNNAKNWYPSIQDAHTNVAVTHYAITIPKLKIIDAEVSTIDNDLLTHLVQYGGTAVPPSKGNAVIFGHSTLPQLYKDGDYRTIFAYAHTMEVGDEIELTVDHLNYTYKVYNITITSPLDTTFFEQNYDDNYLTLVTCTPPGTTWKRLLIKARIVKPTVTKNQ